jgi:hypothetical protein
MMPKMFEKQKSLSLSAWSAGRCGACGQEGIPLRELQKNRAFSSFDLSSLEDEIHVDEYDTRLGVND